MASSRTPVVRVISLFSKEASNLLSRSCVQASLCPWTSGGLEPDAGDPGQEKGGAMEVRVAGGAKEDPRCLACQTSFSSRQEQVDHYRLDWHRYNIKRRLKGLENVDQAHFERLAGDLSSISGSESDSAPSEDELLTVKLDCGPVMPWKCLPKSPYLYFSHVEGSTYSVYRCIVSGSPSGMESSHDLGQALQTLRTPQVWVILMRSGGHFAGAVFRGAEVLVHKTFHRYTVRAKRGTAQSVRDNQQGGHQPKSAGASLRRYNEAALMMEMRDLMTSWSSYITEASCIFIRIPKHSRGVLVGDKGDKVPFLRGDPRLRDLPFPTRRPTFKEVRAAHSKLATVYVGVVRSKTPPQPEETRTDGMEGEGQWDGKGMGRVEEWGVNKPPELPPPDTAEHPPDTAEHPPDTAEHPPDTAEHPPDTAEHPPDTAEQSVETVKAKRKKKGKKKPAQVSAAKDPDVPEFVRKLLMVCEEVVDKEDQVTRVMDLLKESGLNSIEEPKSAECAQTLSHLNAVWNGAGVLHTAASNGCSHLIPIFLLYGADPAIKNQSGHTPYLVAKTKEVRDSFRRFMSQFPAGYNYEHSHIPSPLTQDMEVERSRKEAERKKEKKKLRKQKDKEKQCELVQQQTTASLSDREKRAMAAEKRMVKQLPHSSLVTQMRVCSGCGQSLVGVVPFERLDFKYCRMECLKEHRKQLTTK